MTFLADRSWFTYILAIFFLAFAIEKAQAQADNSSAEQNMYQLVSTAEALNEEDCYLIGCKGYDKKLYLMSHKQPIGKNNKRLLGIAASSQPPAAIYEPPTATIWRLKKGGSKGIAIIAADGVNKLCAQDGSKTDMELSDKGPTYWNMTCTAEGTFTFAHPESSSNYLSIYVYTQPLFGNYKGYDSNQLYLYRLTQHIGETTGEARLPENGARVGIYAKGVLATSSPEGEMKGQDASHLLLRNGTFAPDLHGSVWTCRHKGNEQFTLTNEEGLHLNASLKPDTEAAVWQIENGKITIANASSGHDILVFDAERNRFVLVDATADVDTELATFVSIGHNPDSTLKEGVKILSGAWSTARLSATEWKGATALDLTGISLPNKVEEFAHRPSDRHTYIYINVLDTESASVPWDFLIGKKGDAYSLLTTTSLTDKQALSFDREFQVADKQLSYTRKAAPGTGWETIVLPFSADVPKNWVAQIFRRYESGKLSFEETKTIPAHTPAIIRRLNEADTESVTFLSNAGTIKTALPETDLFKGTYAPLTVASAEEGFYLLKADGTAFVRAAAGSKLMPFRAGILLGSPQASPRRSSKASLSLPHTTDK